MAELTSLYGYRDTSTSDGLRSPHSEGEARRKADRAVLRTLGHSETEGKSALNRELVREREIELAPEREAGG